MKVSYWSDQTAITRDDVKRLSARYGHLDAEDLLRVMMEDELPGRLVMVSSFGIESAVLLDLIAGIDPKFPVLFLDTGQLFAETLAYRDQLIDCLGLESVTTVEPDPQEIARYDRDGVLWQVDPDGCCHMRKVLPLEKALEPYSGWITGRKRYHGGVRINLPVIELSNGKVKLNPLAKWTPDRVKSVFTERGLPRHPLEAKGYHSVGCQPCTAKAVCADNVREGRWKGHAKTECGIHIDAGGRVRRLA